MIGLPGINRVDKYIKDKNCGFLCSNQLWYELLLALADNFRLVNQSKVFSELPYIFGGSQDPLSSGDGLKKLAKSYRKAGLSKVSLSIYPEARHELLHELNCKEVLSELVVWLNCQL